MWPLLKVLIPLDGSKLAEAVLPWATQLAQAFDAQVTLLRVVGPRPEGGPLEYSTYVEKLFGQAEASAGDYLKGQAKGLGARGLKTETAVLLGEAKDEIVAFARSRQVDLIAMGTHGRTGVTRWAYGSVTDRVLHSCHLPLLVVRPPARGVEVAASPLKRVIVPLDGSDLAESVLPVVEDLAGRMGLEVVLVQVVPS